MQTTASAQLTWGTNGNGGSGYWDSSANWYDGTSNVPWVSGDTGTFAGPAGTVSLTANQTASQLIFANSTGTYILTGGFSEQLLGTSSGLTIETDSDAVISAPISISSGSLIKTGTGNLSLSYDFNSIPSYAVNSGMLTFLVPIQIGNGPISLGVAGTSSGTLNFAIPNKFTLENVSSNITAQGNGGDTITVTGSNSFGESVSFSGTIAIENTTLNLIGSLEYETGINGPIIGTTASSTLNVEGFFSLSSTNTTISVVNVSSGVLYLETSGVLPSNAAVTLNNSTLVFGFASPVSQTLASLTDSAANPGVVINENSSGTSQLTINNGVDDTFHGQLGEIISGFPELSSFSLTKTGSGTLTLTGTNNTYNGGTTVISGALIVANSSGSATGSGTVSVSSGATLGGSGTINSSNIAINGRVQAGMGGTDTTSFLTMTSTGSTAFTNANLVFNLNATTPGQGNELVLGATPSATFTTSTLTLNFQNSGTIADGTAYLLITSTGTGTGIGGSIFGGDLTVSGSDVISGLTVDFNTPGFANSYLKLVADSSGTGYDIELITGASAVPEPGTWALFLSGLTGLGFFWFGKRSRS